uniref:Methionine--tRNA ligase, mitochondrial n=1 Tax=Strongyloides venezuelensis TaxID=75913 RepID=A0A0K0FLJ5_STRVS
MFQVLKNVSSLKILFSRKKTFITSPIYYVNASPHIGHVYSTVIADAAFRYDKLRNPSTNNNDFIFITGTDEHGQKVQKAANNANKSPKEFCDDISKNFRDIFNNLNIKYTHFARTTDESHIKCVQKMWEILYSKGYIYKSKYSGYYSHVDEAFYKEKDVEEIEKDNKITLISKETKNEVQYLEEENYMFKLENLYPKIKKWITENDVIRPKHYINQILMYMNEVEDLSISRDVKRMNWGIPVPNDPSQTIYVWMDALMNYMSAVRQPNDHLIQWPPSWQIIGKDIMKFHAIYWPAFLLAADMELPKKLFIHGHWTIDNVKMSKSLGNVVNPFELSNVLSPDGLRYFLLKQGVPDSDNNYSNRKAINLVNADLVNNIGNLLSRSTVKRLNPVQLYFPENYSSLDPKILDEAQDIVEELKVLSQKVNQHYENLIFYKGLEEIMSVCKKVNTFFHNTQPWKKSSGNELSSILYITYETLRVIGLLMQPITPNYSSNLLNQLGIPENKRTLNYANFSLDEFTRTSLSKEQKPLLKRIDILEKKP